MQINSLPGRAYAHAEIVDALPYAANVDAQPAAARARPAPPREGASWTEVGRVRDLRLSEISGVVSGRRTPGVLWAHNDSGDSARIFALGTDGRVLGEVQVRGARAVDWEDIAVGPGPASSPGPWLYVGDIGDNKLRRPDIQLYRFPEPAATDGQVQAQSVTLRYPDGRSRNAEALLVDPRSGDVIIVTKEKRSAAAEVYRVTQAAMAGGSAQLQRIGATSITEAVTGADIAPDGSSLLVRSYNNVYSFARAADAELGAALLATPSVHTAPRSEAIAYAADAATWYSINEGRDVPVMARDAGQVKRPAAP